MAGLLLHLMIISKSLSRLIAILLVGTLITGCSTITVVNVEGEVPRPLVEPYPITVAVFFPETLRNYKYVDDRTRINEGGWEMDIGEVQVNLWETILPAVFEKVVFVENYDDLENVEVDAIFVPDISEMQLTDPKYTQLNVWEIWFKYQFRWFEKSQMKRTDKGGIDHLGSSPFSGWQTTAYGKIPYDDSITAPSRKASVNMTAIKALRDTGANFILSLPANTGLRSLLANRETENEG
jgi:hypothetical protein